MKPKFKNYEFALTPEMKAQLPDGNGIGAASVMGMIDSTGDCIFPGAFSAKVLKDFVQGGFIAKNHDWQGLPIGMPVSAKQVGNQLVCEWRYHDTPDAQDARKVAQERLAAGKGVGLSIGFMPDWEKIVRFESGAKLLDYAEANGYDMSLFDTKQIKAWKGTCWGLIEVLGLFEFSQVTVPANPSAQASDVKSGIGKAKSRSNTLGAVLQAKIHQSFTVAADEAAIRGYMDVEERIALSGLIGDALKTFASTIDPEVAGRELDAADVDWIASKDLRSGLLAEPLLGKHLDSVLAAVCGVTARIANYKGTRDEDERPISKERLDQVKAFSSRLTELIGECEKAMAPDTSEIEAKYAQLAHRTLASRADRLAG